jgi:hypothetical protein
MALTPLASGVGHKRDWVLKKERLSVWCTDDSLL